MRAHLYRRDPDLDAREREQLLFEVLELSADFRDRPDQVGLFIEDLDRRGRLGPGDLERLLGAVAERFGEDFARRIGRDTATKAEVVAEMERIYGRSFSGVTLRTDEVAAARADAMGVSAYTDGREIGFARGALRPESAEGRALIAHEFAHVAQKAGGTGGSLLPGPRGLELDADQAALDVLAGRRPRVAPAYFAKAGNRRALAPGQLEIAPVGGGYMLTFPIEDAHTYRIFHNVWNAYFTRVFAGASTAVAWECREAIGAGWVMKPPDTPPKGAKHLRTGIAAVQHAAAVRWMHEHYPDIHPVKNPKPKKPAQRGRSAEGRARDIEQFVPRARLVIEPPSRDHKYVKGSTITARVVFDSSCEIFNVFPRKVIFDWSIDTPAEKGKGLWFDGRGNIDETFSLDAAGEYRIRVSGESIYFASDMPILASPTLKVKGKRQRAREVYEEQLVGDDESKPFELDDEGEIKLKDGETSTSQVDKLLDALEARIKALQKQRDTGKLPADEADAMIERLREQIGDLVTERAKTELADKSYVVRGAFSGSETSVSHGIIVTMTSSSYQEGDQLHVEVRLVDMTLDASNRGVFSGHGSAKVEGNLDAVRRAAEKAAIDDACAAWRRWNRYEDGLLRVTFEIHGGTLYTRTVRTDSAVKTARNAAGYVALVGLVAGGVAAAPATGGGSVVATVAVVGLAVGTGATLVSIADNVAHREGTRADRELTMDCVSIAAQIIGMGGASKFVQTASRAGKTMYAATELGLDVADGVLISQDARDRMLEIDAEYYEAIGKPGVSAEELDRLAADRKKKLAGVVAGAAQSTAFMFYSAQKNMKAFAEAIGPSGLRYEVRNEVKQLAESGDVPKIEAALKDEGRVLTESEKALLGDVIASKDPTLDAGGTAAPKPPAPKSPPAGTGKQPSPGGTTPQRPKRQGGGAKATDPAQLAAQKKQLQQAIADVPGDISEGSCKATTERLATRIFTNSGGTIRPDRFFNGFHYYLKVGEIIIDPTAGQFIDLPAGSKPPILVGTKAEILTQLQGLIDAHGIRRKRRKAAQGKNEKWVPEHVQDAEGLWRMGFEGGELHTHGEALKMRPSGKAADYDDAYNRKLRAEAEAKRAEAAKRQGAGQRRPEGPEGHSVGKERVPGSEGEAPQKTRVDDPALGYDHAPGKGNKAQEALDESPLPYKDEGKGWNASEILSNWSQRDAQDETVSDEVRCGAQAVLAGVIMQGPKALADFASRLGDALEARARDTATPGSQRREAMLAAARLMTFGLMAQGGLRYRDLSSLAHDVMVAYAADPAQAVDFVGAHNMARAADAKASVVYKQYRSRDGLEAQLDAMAPGESALVHVDTGAADKGGPMDVSQGNHYVTVGREPDAEGKPGRVYLYDSMPREGGKQLVYKDADPDRFWAIFETSERDGTLKYNAVISSMGAEGGKKKGFKPKADKADLVPGLDEMSDAERVSGAARALGYPDLSPDQRRALLHAHNDIGTPPYSAADLKKKAKALRSGGFSPDEASLLMRQGWAGKPDPNAPKSKLSAKEKKDYAGLKSRASGSLTKGELERLSRLRNKRGVQDKPAAWTAEHKAYKWKRYDGNWKFKAWAAQYERNKESTARGLPDQRSALTALDVTDNDWAGERREYTSKTANEHGEHATTRPDSVTEGAILDVKSLKPGPDAQSASVLYMSDQLRVQREAADLGFEGEGGKQRSFVIVMTSTDRRGVRPSANVANPEKGGADAVLHRDSRTGHWHIWSSAGEGEWVRIDQQRARDIAQNGIPEDIYE